MAKILICEDDQLYRQIAEVAFAGSGHELVFVEDGVSALTQLQRQPIDLLITDLVMPNKDGLEVIQDFRRSGTTITILVMSGGMASLKTSLFAAASALGANDALPKPFRPQALRERAEALLSNTHALRADKIA